MKKIIIIFAVLCFTLFFPQEGYIGIEKVKIGRYKYEIFLSRFYNIENNISSIFYELRFKNKLIHVGTYLSFRRNESSKKYSEKLESWHPDDPRQFYKDGIVLGEGKMDIDKKNKTITNTFTIFYKDHPENNSFDKRIQIYKQKKDGFFEIILVKEYYNSDEKIIFKK